MTESIIAALLSALVERPDDHDLRRHVAPLLIAAGRAEEAWQVAVDGLATRPDDVDLLRVAVEAGHLTGRDTNGHERILSALTADGTDPLPPPSPTPPVAEPVVMTEVPDTVDELVDSWSGLDAVPEPDIGAFSRPGARLADIGGMTAAKQQIERSFLAPMRNPDLQRAFGKAAGGGLVLWGPPGGGKTFLARALAGELGANFYEVGLNDVLDIWVGSSEQKLAAIFEFARRQAPFVVFFDERDAIGQKLANLSNVWAAIRYVINQLLAELDGATSDNDGVFFLAATNHPWDLDPALVRPGRFDRKLLVLPPDRAAREAIFDVHLRDRPTAGDIDTKRLAKVTDGFSGAVICLICEDATETALAASIDAGDGVKIDHQMLKASRAQVRPSIGPWLDVARNYATFANDDGDLAELVAYLKKHK